MYFLNEYYYETKNELNINEKVSIMEFFEELHDY